MSGYEIVRLDEIEELYLVLRGQAVLELDGKRVDAPRGTFVFVRPGIRRTAFAGEAGTTIIAVGGVAGRPFPPVGRELCAAIRPLYEAGEYAAAAERGRAVIEAHPEYPELFSDLACCESLAGETAEAIEHLRLAIERSERCRAHARGDPDLAAIRDEPAFAGLLGG